jgi:hypothetical protein
MIVTLCDEGEEQSEGEEHGARGRGHDTGGAAPRRRQEG